MLILTNNFLNFIEIINLVFEIGVFISVVRIEWLRKYLGSFINLYNFSNFRI